MNEYLEKAAQEAEAARDRYLALAEEAEEAAKTIRSIAGAAKPVVPAQVVVAVPPEPAPPAPAPETIPSKRAKAGTWATETARALLKIAVEVGDVFEIDSVTLLRTLKEVRPKAESVNVHDSMHYISRNPRKYGMIVERFRVPTTRISHWRVQVQHGRMPYAIKQKP